MPWKDGHWWASWNKIMGDHGNRFIYIHLFWTPSQPIPFCKKHLAHSRSHPFYKSSWGSWYPRGWRFGATICWRGRTSCRTACLVAGDGMSAGHITGEDIDNTQIFTNLLTYTLNCAHQYLVTYLYVCISLWTWVSRPRGIFQDWWLSLGIFSRYLWGFENNHSSFHWRAHGSHSLLKSSLNILRWNVHYIPKNRDIRIWPLAQKQRYSDLTPSVF